MSRKFTRHGPWFSLTFQVEFGRPELAIPDEPEHTVVEKNATIERAIGFRASEDDDDEED